MKKVLSIFGILLVSACTLSDQYYLPAVGSNNVGTAVGMYQKSEDGYVKEYVNFEGNCIYLLGIFKLSNDCSPTKIANKYNLKTITEQNTQWQLWPFMRVQKTVITGIPKDKK